MFIFHKNKALCVATQGGRMRRALKAVWRETACFAIVLMLFPIAFASPIKKIKFVI